MTAAPSSADSASLTAVEQVPASAMATVAVEDKPVTEIWAELFQSQAVCEAFIESLRGYCRDRSRLDVYDDLADAGVPFGLFSRVVAVGRGDRREAWRLVSTESDSVRKLGQSGHTTVEDLLATASLFEATEQTEPLAFVLEDQEFRELRRDQREDVLALIATLSRAFDVRLVMSGITRLWLREYHRADLPGVSDWCNAQGEIEHIEEALQQLDRDSCEVRLLQALREDTGEAISYANAYARATVSKSRVRQCIATLAELGLVETFGPDADRMVSLRDAGREFVERTIERQQTISECVSDAPKSAQQRRVAQPPGREGEGGESGEGRKSGGTGGLYRTGWMSRVRHNGAVACGSAQTVSLVDTTVDTDSKARLVSYDRDREEAVVSVPATTPLQYTVSTAVALASPKFLDKALPVDRLDDLLEDEPVPILRDGRCIGGISAEAVEDSRYLYDALVDWGEELEEMTTRLQTGDCLDRNRLRGEITRSAHGLAGTVVHLLDAADIDIVRELRIPGSTGTEKLQDVAKSVAISATIQSRYGGHNIYRQLFEQREDKRQSAFSPDVDAADPTGTLIGSFVVCGGSVDRKAEALRRAFESPAELHEDAPEIVLPVSVDRISRSAYSHLAQRYLPEKNLLRPRKNRLVARSPSNKETVLTSEARTAVSLLHAFAGTPYDAAQALGRLGAEDTQREIRPDDLRYALSKLDADQLLTDMAPSVGEIVKVLLEATEPLSQSTLADRAGVSAQTLRNHRDKLVGLDLVRITDSGWRVSLSFDTPEEWHDPVCPTIVGDRLTDALDPVLLQCLRQEEYVDPEHPVGQVLFHPQTPWELLDTDRFEGVVRVAGALAETAPPAEATTVIVGPEVAQTPLSSPGQPAVAE